MAGRARVVVGGLEVVLSCLALVMILELNVVNDGRIVDIIHGQDCGDSRCLTVLTEFDRKLTAPFCGRLNHLCDRRELCWILNVLVVDHGTEAEIVSMLFIGEVRAEDLLERVVTDVALDRERVLLLEHVVALPVLALCRRADGAAIVIAVHVVAGQSIRVVDAPRNRSRFGLRHHAWRAIRVIRRFTVFVRSLSGGDGIQPRGKPRRLGMPGAHGNRAHRDSTRPSGRLPIRDVQRLARLRRQTAVRIDELYPRVPAIKREFGDDVHTVISHIGALGAVIVAPSNVHCSITAVIVQ